MPSGFFMATKQRGKTPLSLICSHERATRFLVLSSAFPEFISAIISRTSALDFSVRLGRSQVTVSFFQLIFFHQERGLPPSNPFQRWSPSGSGGGQPQSCAK